MNLQKIPTFAKVLCVCGHVVVIPVLKRTEIICNQCNTTLWVETVKYDEQNDIVYFRPVAKVPKNFRETVLPNTPTVMQAIWTYPS